jgi:hypothetical protein
MGYLVSTTLASVPSTGHDWYVFLLEDNWSDDLRDELSRNFETLAYELGPNCLAVRGLNRRDFNEQVAQKYSETFRDAGAFRDHLGSDRGIEPPALVVTDTAPRVLETVPPGAASEIKIRTMVFPLRKLRREPGRVTDFLAMLAKSLRNDEAIKALDRSQFEEVRSFWGWLRFFELKPNFCGIGINLNAVFEEFEKRPYRQSWV